MLGCGSAGKFNFLLFPWQQQSAQG